MSLTADILIRADASPSIGGGHVMRCLVLADALAGRGVRCRFLVGPQTMATVPRLAASGHSVDPAPSDPADYPAAAATVFDLYTAGREDHRRARLRTPTIVVIDDLADRPLDADMVVDFTFGRDASAYAPHVRPAIPILVGPQFALLRPEFARLRPRALARRAQERIPRRLFISFGLTDFGSLTLPAMCAGQDAGFEVDVAIGPSAPLLEEILRRADPDRTRVHVDAPDVATLMAEADLAIGAGGTASWERCCLGLPSLLAVVADNQQDIAAGLSDAGAVLPLPRGREADAIGPALRQALAGDLDLGAMSRAARAICDGAGAARVADRILSL